MNIIDYSLKLGELIRSTPEGKNLLEIYDKVSKKYHGSESSGYSLFNQCVESKASAYNFFCWQISLDQFKYAHDHPSEETHQWILDVATEINNDEDITQLCYRSKLMGDAIALLCNQEIVLSKKPTLKGLTCSNAIVNAAQNLQISIQRSGLLLYVSSKLQNKAGKLQEEPYVIYEKNRRERNLLPYSQGAIKLITAANDLDKDCVECLERIMLIQHITQKGIFEGFWNIFNVLTKEQVSDIVFPDARSLQESSFSHTAFVNEIIHKESWIYILDFEEKMYLLAGVSYL